MTGFGVAKGEVKVCTEIHPFPTGWPLGFQGMPDGIVGWDNAMLCGQREVWRSRFV